MNKHPNVLSRLVSLAAAVWFGLLIWGSSVEVYASSGTRFTGDSSSGIQTRLFKGSRYWLRLEFVADDVIHFEYGPNPTPTASDPIYRSPLMADAVWSGTSTFTEHTPNSFSTSDLTVNVDGLCLKVEDRLRGVHVGEYCLDGYKAEVVAPETKGWKTLKVHTHGVKNAFGLGQLFDAPGTIGTDRLGKVNTTPGDFGNIMSAYAGGATGQTMFPVLYALGQGAQSWMLIVDNVYKQTWDLTRPLWKIGMFGDKVSGYVVVGANPKALRQRLMSITGRSPIPHRKLFGFWMSEYGYDNWREIDDRLRGMRRDRFPIDGFFLDLQWFGNVSPGSDYTAMGKLTFDETKFPEPRETIDLYRQDGIGLIPIEESYVGKALVEHDDLEGRGFLAHKCGNTRQASYLTGEVTGNTSEWWGRGGMIDWSNPKAGAYWHDIKRQDLINMGLMGHWLDLGEPEMFDPSSCYYGSGEMGKVSHQDVHNLFSFFWVKSVFEGYKRTHPNLRPYSILRSGNLGMQRFGGTLWSGDISGNLESLVSHMASHANVSWSGIDYYSSDIGGFHRNRVNGHGLSDSETKESFTQWFANATWLDVPVRSHVMNLGNDRLTAPNKIGHVESNRHNLIQRYKLIPYYYSLAWKAHLHGDPLISPVALEYPEDEALRASSDLRMLGDLLIVPVASKGLYQRSIRLPKGEWYDLRLDVHESSAGLKRSTLGGVPLYIQGLFQIPVYARAGAMITETPEEVVLTKRGLTSDGSTSESSDHLSVRVFPDLTGRKSTFNLIEDDGQSTAYTKGEYRQITLSQISQPSVNQQIETIFHISKASQNHAGLANERTWHISVYRPKGHRFVEAHFGNQKLSWCGENRRTGLHGSQNCLIQNSKSIIGFDVVLSQSVWKSDVEIVVRWEPKDEQYFDSSAIHFVCKDSGDSSQRYYGMYVVGNHEKLGSWDPLRGIPMSTNSLLNGVWTLAQKDLPAATDIEWKCVKVYPQTSGRGVDWQPGQNNQVSTLDLGGYAGHSVGVFPSP